MGPDPADPRKFRRRWRRRRRKWYVKLSASLGDHLLALRWKGRLVLASVSGLLLLVIFNPFANFDVPGIGAEVEGRERIECMISGQSEFEQMCTVEKLSGPGGTRLIARAPDGAFRRFMVVKDGRRVIAADGAEEVKVKRAGSGSIDVISGDITWRLPVGTKD